jgi:Abortive infection C-terminus
VSIQPSPTSPGNTPPTLPAGEAGVVPGAVVPGAAATAVPSVPAGTGAASRATTSPVAGSAGASAGGGSLSPRSIAAIAALIPKSADAERLLADAGLSPVPGRKITEADLTEAAAAAKVDPDHPAAMALVLLMGLLTLRRGPGIVTDTLAALDTAQPDQLAAVLELANRAAEYYTAGRRHDRRKLLDLRDALAADGYTFDPATRAVASPVTVLAAGPVLRALSMAATPAAIREAATRLAAAVVDDPYVAIGQAKNLVEATGKYALHARGVPFDAERIIMPELIERVHAALGLVAGTPGVDGLPALERLTVAAGQAATALSTLRNKAGDGHGRLQPPAGLRPRHGQLAAVAAAGWCQFILDTLEELTSATAPAASAMPEANAAP